MLSCPHNSHKDSCYSWERLKRRRELCLKKENMYWKLGTCNRCCDGFNDFERYGYEVKS